MIFILHDWYICIKSQFTISILFGNVEKTWTILTLGKLYIAGKTFGSIQRYEVNLSNKNIPKCSVFRVQHFTGSLSMVGSRPLHLPIFALSWLIKLPSALSGLSTLFHQTLLVNWDYFIHYTSIGNTFYPVYCFIVTQKENRNQHFGRLFQDVLTVEIYTTDITAVTLICNNNKRDHKIDFGEIQ